MGFFGDSMPKRVSAEEMKEVIHSLYGKLDEDERVEVEKLFRADLGEPGIEAGITEAELVTALDWLRANQKKHKLEESDIALIERYCREHLED